jgi:hypothetical protein
VDGHQLAAGLRGGAHQAHDRRAVHDDDERAAGGAQSLRDSSSGLLLGAGDEGVAWSGGAGAGWR